MSDTATTASYFSKEEYARYVALIDEYFSEDCIAIMEAALEARFAKLVLDHPDLYSGEGPPRLVRRLRHNDPYLVQYLAKFIVILQEAVQRRTGADLVRLRRATQPRSSLSVCPDVGGGHDQAVKAAAR